MNCLSVFDHFVWLVLKGLTNVFKSLVKNPRNRCNEDNWLNQRRYLVRNKVSHFIPLVSLYSLWKPLVF